MGQQIRGRGGAQYFRGGRGGARFPNSGNFDPNWNGPPMYGNSHMGFGNQQGDQQNAPFHQVRTTTQHTTIGQMEIISIGISNDWIISFVAK